MSGIIRLVPAALGSLLAASLAPDAAGEVKLTLGPTALSRTIHGVQVSSPITAFLTLNVAKEVLHVEGRVQADLGDLQGKIGAIVDSIPLPTDNCRSFSANNPVVRAWGKELQLAGKAAVLRLKGEVDIWDCRENPIPNSKVVWVDETVLGVNIRRPRVETWPGDPIKTLLANQPFDATVEIAVRRVDQHSASVQFERTELRLGGQYAGVTNGVLSLGGVDLNAHLAERLRDSVDPDQLRHRMPSELAEFEPRLQSVEFVDIGGRLGLQALITVAVPPARVAEVFERLIPKEANPVAALEVPR